MPTTYTHYAYGQEVKNLLPDKLQDIIDSDEDLYNIGVHGPDILFYYRAFSKNKVNQYGVRVHKEPMEVYLDHAFPVFKKQHRKRAAFAYLAGFMTHFILDSTCHPYIGRRIRETGISHAEIERDWDSVMMRRDHLNPLKYHVTSHIHVLPGYSSLIAPYYDMRPAQIRTSLLDMKLILDHIFRSTFAITGRLAALANTFVLRNMNYQHYFAKKSINPGNVDTINELDLLYQGSIDECVNMITKLYQALAADDPSFSKDRRFKRHFNSF